MPPKHENSLVRVGRSAGSAGYRNLERIKVALNEFVTKHNFCKYTTDRDITAISVELLSGKRYMRMIRRMHALSPTWHFLPLALTQVLIGISKDHKVCLKVP